ncbi:hypothetical protein TL16_g06155 [Triparma laevis f. inornata]|uniref:Uncharacterized protein n=2 Tax=Triparma laevis TaxID=1534972 RepID=A0A9W6ZYQ9_9STRA|nr:hypothetical protein TrLO_g1065 [Triparma laevis f. longispina]GMH73319.1 hypothetical protein TL16_g06155 [Triparma laevis f. inornata]
MEQQPQSKKNDILDTEDALGSSTLQGAESRKNYTTAQNVASGPISRPVGKRKSFGGRESKRRKSTSGVQEHAYQRPKFHVDQTRVINKEHHLKLVSSNDFSPSLHTPLSLTLCPAGTRALTSNSNSNNASAFRLALRPRASKPEANPSLFPSDVTLGFVTGDNFESWLKSIKSESGYGELDAVAYTKDGRPYVNRLTLSKLPSNPNYCLAMLQEFRTALSNPPRAITDSTNSSNQSNSDFNNSSSNDTSSNSSSTKRDPKNLYARSNSGSDSAVNDSDIVDFIAASSGGESEQSERSSTPQEENDNSEENNSNDGSDGVEVTDNDVANFLVDEADDVEGDDEEGDEVVTTKQNPQKMDLYLVAARIDLETACRAAWASSFGSNELLQRSTSSYSLTSVGNNESSSNSDDSSTKKGENHEAITKAARVKKPQSPSKDNLGSVETFMKFMKDSDHAFVLLSPLGLIMSSNAAFTNLSGYKLQEVEQKKISEVLGGPGTDEEKETLMWKDASVVIDGKVSPAIKLPTVTTLLHYNQTNVAFLNGLRAYKIGAGTQPFWAVSMENRSNRVGTTKPEKKKKAAAEGMKVMADVILVSI